MRYPMLKKVPFLAIAVISFTAFFVSLVFIYCSPMTGYGAGVASESGRVLGVSEAAADYTWDELYGSDNLLPSSADVSFVPAAPERTEPGDDMQMAAKSSAALDIGSGKVIFDQEADRQAPIASITKLMTALVFLDHNPGWDSVYTLEPEDNVEGGRIYVYSGEMVRVRDLFYLSLVASANTATMALVNSTGLSPDEFVAAMNKRAGDMGLSRTSFTDPVGLSGYDVSTAGEVVRLAAAAFGIKEIRDATLTNRYEFSTVGGRKVNVASTDSLLEIFPQNGVRILGGKTGYTEPAGYCFTGKFADAAGHEVVSAVLGTGSPNLRFSQTGELVEWLYNNYSWPKR